MPQDERQDGEVLTEEETKTREGEEQSGQENIRAQIEAVLFAMGESVSIDTLTAALGMEDSRQQVEAVLQDMMKEYERQDRGIRIVRLEDSYQLCTKKEMYPVLIRIAKAPKKIMLTDVIMETLAIVAYRQPVTRAEIEKIRGVSCDHAINRLLEYDLIQEVGRLDAPGRPILFGTTEEFLRHFGTDSVDDLPAISPVKVEDFKAEAEEEADVRLGV